MTGIAIGLTGMSAVRALYVAAVINGALAPFLLLGIVHAAADRKLMRGQPSSKTACLVVGATALVMCGAAIAMFLS